MIVTKKELSFIAAGATACLALLMLIAGVLWNYFQGTATVATSTSQPASVTQELETQIPVATKPLIDRESNPFAPELPESAEVTDVSELPTDLKDPIESNPIPTVAIQVDSHLIPASIATNEDTEEAQSEEGTLERIHAYTIDQWVLPEQNTIVEAGIFRWIDEEEAFHLRQPLAFAKNSLLIEASQGGLGQPITLFRLNPHGTFRAEKTKWELDHHTDWLMIRTNDQAVMLAIGREPTTYAGSSVVCDVLGEIEPVGSDEPGMSLAPDGLLEVPINTFRASKVVDGIMRWTVVPPFSKSRLFVDDQCVPWEIVQRSGDGLSCRWTMETQGDWMVAVEDDDAGASSTSESMSEVRYERRRQHIRTLLAVELTSTLDDRLSGNWSHLYVDELSERQRDTLRRTLRRSSSRRSGWRRPTSPMDLQAEDTAYLRLSWFHFRSGGVIDPDTPNMTDIAPTARQRPIDMAVAVPRVAYIDGRFDNAEPTYRQLVFAEFQVTCQ